MVDTEFEVNLTEYRDRWSGALVNEHLLLTTVMDHSVFLVKRDTVTNLSS